MQVSQRISADRQTADEARRLLLPRTPAYCTRRGAVFLGDALDLLRDAPTGCANLVITSPPYTLEFKTAYGNEPQERYIEWFLPFASEIKRVLANDGSFVLNIGGAWRKGHPVRSLYHFKLLIALVETIGFHLAQEIYWYNPAKMPAPAQWTNVERIRVKDSIEPCWWLSKSERPRANNRNVLVPYSDDMRRLIQRGFRAKVRPSGHRATEGWQADHGGAIPGNVLTLGNTDSNGRYIALLTARGLPIHPARFPVQLPEWFIRFLTERGDLIIDPFGGSMTAGWAAERLDRRWLGFEMSAEYVEASRWRFFNDDDRLLSDAELGADDVSAADATESDDNLSGQLALARLSARSVCRYRPAGPPGRVGESGMRTKRSARTTRT
ncbi:MAG: site-specific DNA-methyltransferase, partial [Chloroflexi bacterium]|nr:site-specific DNA-methyltransferase [Chloroflexota bacterium]